MTEFYKDIPEFEGLYQISNLGNVKSLRSNIIMKPRKNNAGYYYIQFSVNQKKTKKSSQNVTDENERNSMAYIALRLYIESEVNKLIADKIMSQLSNEILPKRVLNETDIQKIDNKKTLMEAKKLSGRNKR